MAAKLWGAAEVEREALGAPLDPDDKVLVEPYVAGGRSELGTGAWTAAWDEGRAMTLEEVVEDMLSVEGVPPFAPSDPLPEQAGNLPAVLSSREREVATLVAQGLTNRSIASQLSISERTVDHHVSSILTKLDLTSRVQVASRLEGK
jgi:non-specific serine/threonine protein kinase